MANVTSLMVSTPRAAARWVLHRWEWIPTIAGLAIAGGLLYFLALGGASHNPAARPTAIVAVPPAFSPIRIVRLEIEPDVLVPGQPARLLNGICNDLREPQAVAIYFGLQEVGPDPVVARKVDFVGSSGPPEARQTSTIDPGCYRTDPIDSILEAGRVPPGTWRAVLNISARGPRGEEQNVSQTSRAFEVRAAPASPIPAPMPGEHQHCCGR